MPDLTEIPDLQLDELRAAARSATARAYAPYSGFAVGAALRTDDGTIISGCNVENVSFGHTICAERAAVVAAVAAGHRGFQAMAIAVDGSQGSPCGACRQVLVEFAPDMTVTFHHDGADVTCRARDLLPQPFLPGALDR